MSSSSDAFRSEKAVAQRKKKLQNELNESKKDRLIVRPKLGEITESRSDGVDEPPSPSSFGNAIEYDVQPMKKETIKKSTPLSEKKNNRRSWSIDDETSSSTPGERIQKIFHKRATGNVAPIYSVTSRSRMKAAIEDAQKRVCKDTTQNENEETKTAPQETTDLRSLYKTYMSGNIKKERVVRMGAEWTSGYRSRRLQRGKPRKVSNYTHSKSMCDDSVASEASYGRSVASSPALMQQTRKKPTKIDEMGFASFD